jgi:perosamine synthetase
MEKRKRIFAAYRESLTDIPGIGFQPIAAWAEAAPWLFCITVTEKEYGRSRDDLMAILADVGIETRPFFMSLHHLPPFREESYRRRESLPVTDRLSAEGMNLPTYTQLSESDLEQIVKVIRSSRR